MIQTATASAVNFSYPSEAENAFNVARSAAAAPETEAQMDLGAARTDSPLSTTVDIGPGPDPSPKKPSASFWSRIVSAATVVEEHVAEWFGFNQSKYQWAVDEFMDRQLAGESPVTPASSTALNELKPQPMSQQAMHRNANQVEGVNQVEDV